MIEEEQRLHFSYELQRTQTADEKLANVKLQELKNGLVTPMFNVTIHDFYDYKERL